MADIEKLYDLEEVGGVLKVTRQCLYNYIKAGKLKAMKYGKSWRVKEHDLKEFIEKGHN